MITLSKKEKQGCFNPSPHPKQKPKPSKCQPLHNTTFYSHTQIPAISKTENSQYPKKQPISQNGKTLESNKYLPRLEENLKKNKENSLEQEIKQKKNNMQKTPPKKSLLKKIIDLPSKITQKQAQGHQKYPVPPKTIITLLVITPIIHLGTLHAQNYKTLQYSSKEKIEMAYNHLQTLNGNQLKYLLQTIPEKNRVQLVESLPSRLLPPLIPKNMAAHNLNLIPDKELQKSFSKLTKQEFTTAAQTIPTENQEALFKLLLETINKKTTKPKLGRISANTKSFS